MRAGQAGGARAGAVARVSIAGGMAAAAAGHRIRAARLLGLGAVAFGLVMLRALKEGGLKDGEQRVSLASEKPVTACPGTA